MTRIGFALWTVVTALSFSLCLGVAPAAAVPIGTLFSTGVDAGGALLGDYAADPHYSLTASPAYPVASGVTVGVPDLPGAWAANTATSRWINLRPEGFDPTTLVISLAWAADDASVLGTDFIAINGTPLPAGGGGSGTGPDPGSFAGLHLKLITFAGAPFFLPGLNTLSFVTGNADTIGGFGSPFSGPTGVHVHILSAEADLLAPEPGLAALLALALLALALQRRRSVRVPA